MSRPPKTIREDEGFDQAVELMRSFGVRRLPIVDRKGKLRGLVTLDDIVEEIHKDVNAIADLLRRQRRQPKRASTAKPVEAAS